MTRQTPAKQASLRNLAGAAALSFAALVSTGSASFAQTPTHQKEEVTAPVVRRIVVSIPDRQLALLENGQVVKIYDVAVGAPQSPSPSGEFRIVQRLENPTYYKPGVVIGPGANNPLGTRWMGLDVKSFGIHGTNRPNSVGKNASHGCIRLRNEDVEDLFARVRVGDRVSLIAERDEEVAQIFGGSSSPTHGATAVVATRVASEPSSELPAGDR